MSLAAALLAAWTATAAEDAGKSVVSQDITIKGKASSAPAVRVPAPAPEKAVLDEVLESLGIYRGRHAPTTPKSVLKPAAKRLLKPFPEAPFLTFSPRSFPKAHDRWTFEVLSGESPVWRTEGVGRLEEELRWDGRDLQGRMARAAESYWFRFTAFRGEEESALSSEPVELPSLAYAGAKGERRLEAASRLIFAPGRSDLASGATDYLSAMGDRLRREDPRKRPYRIELHQKGAPSKLSRARAEALRRFFSSYLVVSPERVSVEVLGASERGEAASCVVPPDEGPRLKLD